MSKFTVSRTSPIKLRNHARPAPPWPLIRRGDLALEIEAAPFSLWAGEVRGLIRTGAGWNIVRVEQVRMELVAHHAEVREIIRTQLIQEEFEAKRKKWQTGLRAKAFTQILRESPDLVAEPKKPYAVVGQKRNEAGESLSLYRSLARDLPPSRVRDSGSGARPVHVHDTPQVLPALTESPGILVVGIASTQAQALGTRLEVAPGTD